MPDISVRVGQTDAIKVLTTSGSAIGKDVTANVVGGIASIRSIHVSGISTFVGLSTFGSSVYSIAEFRGTEFKGITGLTTIGSFSPSGITTVRNDLYVGGDLDIKGDLSFGNLDVAGIITGQYVTTGSIEPYGITLGPGIGTGDDTIARLSGPANLILAPDSKEGGLTLGTVSIEGHLNVVGNTITQSNQVINIGDFKIGINITNLANLTGAGVGIGSTDIERTFTYSNGDNTLKSSVGLGMSDGGNLTAGANILINKTTLGSTIVGSSLTTVGTLTQLNVTGILTAGGIDGGSF